MRRLRAGLQRRSSQRLSRSWGRSPGAHCMRRPVTPTPEAIDAAPIVADARAAVETARREADAVRSEQRGQLKLTADAGALGVPFVSTFRDHGGGQFLFGFAVPLFDGGVRASHIAAVLA